MELLFQILGIGLLCGVVVYVLIIVGGVMAAIFGAAFGLFCQLTFNPISLFLMAFIALAVLYSKFTGAG